MRVLEASKEDEKGILRLFTQFNEDRIASGVGDAGYQILSGEVPWAKTLNDPECKTYVVKEKGILLGFITVRTPKKSPFPKVEKIAEIDLIVVEKRVRRKGIGSELYKHILDHVKLNEASHILLNVNKANEGALIFWESLGFKGLSDSEYTRVDGGVEKILFMISRV